MPTTRKSSRQSGGPASKQSTLSFNHRVTKNVAKSAKDTVLSPPSDTSVKEKPSSAQLQEFVDDSSALQLEEEGTAQATKKEVDKSGPELEAEKINDAAVESYWKGVESERVAVRVHQEGLTTGEKVLRYFDVSSQYGPCIGIDRTKRWHRAQRLGLNPPLEVLAVLLKEDAKAKGSNQAAYIDDLMNSTATGAA
ncbi:hypothetical protein GQ53DRAFT_786830 [Thozetella sp. PMI_491]|nr:hypothetical protein GQ53DRAFT_786830 [Thozetella sp. PMI_491]